MHDGHPLRIVGYQENTGKKPYSLVIGWYIFHNTQYNGTGVIANTSGFPKNKVIKSQKSFSNETRTQYFGEFLDERNAARNCKHQRTIEQTPAANMCKDEVLRRDARASAPLHCSTHSHSRPVLVRTSHRIAGKQTASESTTSTIAEPRASSATASESSGVEQEVASAAAALLIRVWPQECD